MQESNYGVDCDGIPNIWTVQCNDRGEWEEISEGQITYSTNLCSDVILGHDFEMQHKNLTFCFGGSKEDLVVTSCSSKTASTLEVKHTHPQLTPVVQVGDVEPPTIF